MTIQRQGISSFSIDAQEINIKLGKGMTNELSLDETDAARLAINSSTDSGPPSYGDFKDKTMITTATFFGAIGYDGDLPAGNLTDSVLAPYSSGGYTWEGVGSNQQARLLQLYCTGTSSTSSLRFKVSQGTGNTALDGDTTTWSRIIITHYDTGSQVSSTFKKSYASFDSQGKYWHWSNTNIMGTSGGNKRYIRI